MSEQSERVIDLLEGAAEEGGVGMLNVVDMMLIIVITFVCKLFKYLAILL